MKLAELEAKAKALAGTQHWRGLDPDAVLEALALVKDAMRLASFVRCDMECPSEDHWEDCLVTQYRALKEIAE